MQGGACACVEVFGEDVYSGTVRLRSVGAPIRARSVTTSSVRAGRQGENALSGAASDTHGDRADTRGHRPRYKARLRQSV